MLSLVVAPDILALGAITGVVYGLLAVGLVLVYRASKVINLAHGEIGALGAAAASVVVVRWGVPYWIAFVGALVISAAVGGVTEAMVVRRLRRVPKLMSLVATLGVGQFLLLFSAAINNQASSGSTYPLPPWLPSFRIGELLISSAHSAMLLLSPVVVLGLVAFLRYTRFGLALRAAAANADRARLVGVSASRMSTLAWALAGSVSAFTAILVAPTQGFLTAQALGPTLLSRALVAAVVARMTNLPIALAAGIGVGVVEQVLIMSYPTSPGFVEMVLLGSLTVALLLQTRRGAREEEQEDWTTVQPWPRLSAAMRRVWAIRNLGWMVGVGIFVVGAALPLVLSNTDAVSLIGIVALALVGLSVGIVTGLGGQLSLGQFAIAGVGATASYVVTFNTGNYLLGFGMAALAGAVASLVIGVPALRVRGQMLAVTTLLFALATPAWLLEQSWALGSGVNPGRPIIGTIALDTTKSYWSLTLVVFFIGLLLARNVWRSGLGLQLRAVRDNENAARSFAVSATRARLQGYVVAGLLAGLGGAVFGHLVPRISPNTFDVVTSLNVTAMTVLGGIGLLVGPLLGALYIIGIPAFIPLDNAGLAASALGWLLLILYFPGGIAQLVAPVRGRIVTALARRAGIDPELEEPTVVTDPGDDDVISDAAADDAVERRFTVAGSRPASTAGARPAAGDRLLSVKDLVKHYGGVHAVDGVTLDIAAGETVGLIGPNGAGKTTFFELLSGFTVADSGSVIFAGHDVTGRSPESRAKLGLIRSFQDAALFPSMTVHEVVTLSLERSDPTRFLPSLAGVHRPERRKEERARELIGLVGLERYRDAQISELSTGTRRIAELTCMVALEPTLLLLDEPSSGIAQRETEALGAVLAQIKRELDLTLVIIEHDIPLVMSLADRVVAMESGVVIADGLPAEVQHDPRVVASYLGTDTRSIERSSHEGSVAEVEPAAAKPASPRRARANGKTSATCRATTKAGARCARPPVEGDLCWQHRRLGADVGGKGTR